MNEETNIERVVNEILRNVRKHVQAGENVVHVVINIRLDESQHSEIQTRGGTYKINL